MFKMFSKKSVLTAAAGCLLLSGCGPGGTEGREVIRLAGKSITVIENQNELVVNKAALISLERYEDRIGLGWVDEDTLLMAKTEQSSLNALIRQRMLLFRPGTGKEDFFPGSAYNQVEAELSPDGSAVFYKESEGVNASATGYVARISDRTPVRITEDNAIPVKEGRWTDNGHILYAGLDGSLYVWDTGGRTQKLLGPGTAGATGVRSVMRTDSAVFYIGGDGRLYEARPDGGAVSAVAERVQTAVPSPDGTRIALVKADGPRQASLSFYSVQTGKERPIASGTAFHTSCWSGDGSRLAYSAASDRAGQSGLFITSANPGGETVQLSADIFPGYPITFSPSGRQLLATKVIAEGTRNKTVTYRMTFKK
ncbi:TolB family protein [Paenibacillus chitinolyticus]|uniref:TolB family protein n=1 Tax=Paenibacillus chitinolyticus TaxID=79263 RepID=UPI00365C439E